MSITPLWALERSTADRGKPSADFEKLIFRIHELIEQKGSVVTWNDRISDPDNESQERQVDVSIRCDGKLTLVECRLRKQPQDVKWIEELIGRCLSLRANAVIAVSSSGFTSGAIKKAHQFGVILRDIQTLSEEEVRQWGRSTKVCLAYLQFRRVLLDFIFLSDGVMAPPTVEQVIKHLENSRTLDDLFQHAAAVFERENPRAAPTRMRMKFHANDLMIGNQAVHEMALDTAVKQTIQDLRIPSVVAFGAPNTETSQRAAMVEKVDFGQFEIAQAADRVHTIVDLGLVRCSPNSIFRSVMFDFGRPVRMEKLQLLRAPPSLLRLKDILVRVVVQPL
ncbi:MAG: restriction endonuclease [Sterolibacteriaceae bacterium MAG5]|nr:restriction endonuclease [Candidatus Nitricoxidireducens bremensis]